jgi:hypothetical protein
MEKKIWKVIGFWAMGLILLVATTIVIRWIVDFVNWSNLDSGWAQAIGSIAAILFAYFLGERQAAAALEVARETNRMDARHRYDAIVALAESANIFTARVADVFEEEGFGYFNLKFQYRDAIMDDLIDSVKAVSAQELGSYNAILALTTLREALVNFKGNVTRARASHERLRDPVNNSIPLGHTWDSTALHLCRTQITRSIEGLRRHRPSFAE